MNPLLEAAKSLGDDDSSDTDKPEITPPGENGIGSYERFMTSFGSPARWAGR